MAKYLVAIILVFGIGAIVFAAGGLSLLSDNVSRHAPSIGSDHQFRFKTSQGIGNVGENFTIEFPADFDLSLLLTTDIALSTGAVSGEESSLAVSGSANLTDWGVSISPALFQITLTHPTDNSNGDVAPNEFIVVKIGVNAGGSNQIINSAILGSSVIQISTSLGETGALAVPIAQDQVGLSADVEGLVDAIIQWAVPQQRVGPVETNDDADFYLTVRTQINTDNVILYTQPALLTLNTDGTYLTPISLGSLVPGPYDVGIKTQQHLTKILQDVNLVAGTNTLNFTDPANAAPKGSDILLAGDINGLGTDTSTLGDDVINSVDLSTIITQIDADDPTGNSLRSNLNQDIVVNSVDLSMMIGNLDKEGDR